MLVRDVAPDAPAAKAGIQRGDVLTRFNTEQIRTVEEFLGALREVDPGDKVEIGLHRGGDTSTVTVTLGTLQR